MSEEEKLSQEKTAKAFQNIIDKGAKRTAAILNFNHGFSKVLNELHSHSRGINESNQQNSLKYKDELLLKLASQKTTSERISILAAETKKYKQKFIDAEHRKNGYDKKYYDEVLSHIILPLLDIEKEQLEIERLIPEVKQQIEVSSPVENSKHVSKSPVENFQEQKPIEEKTINIDSKLPEGFKQIDSDTSKEKVLYFFSILSKEKNKTDKNPYMSEVDVEELVKKNFAVFNSVPTGKYFAINLTKREKGKLRYFLQQFYLRYEGIAKAKNKYALFLKWNFELFKNDSLQSILTNMKNKQPKDYIPTKKYFKN